MSKTFSLEAIRLGYSVFYDASLHLWTIIKEGVETEYILPHIMKTVDPEVLIKTYLQN
jgi:hypothetical protein